VRPPARTIVGVPLPRRIPELVAYTVLDGSVQVTSFWRSGREVCRVKTTGWLGYRVDRLEFMARRLADKGLL
jgi:hypothetical protein